MQENVFNEDYLKPLFETLGNSNKDCHIAGDFNFDLLQASSSHDKSEYLDTTMTNFLRPTITIPTKINRVKSTLIDNIFTNQIHPDMRSGNFMIDLSDHLPSFMIFQEKIKIMLPINKITTSARWENLIESSLYWIFWILIVSTR